MDLTAKDFRKPGMEGLLDDLWNNSKSAVSDVINKTTKGATGSTADEIVASANAIGGGDYKKALAAIQNSGIADALKQAAIAKLDAGKPPDPVVVAPTTTPTMTYVYWGVGTLVVGFIIKKVVF